MDVGIDALSLPYQSGPHLDGLGNPLACTTPGFETTPGVAHSGCSDRALADSTSRYPSPSSVTENALDGWPASGAKSAHDLTGPAPTTPILGVNTYQRFEAEDSLLMGGTYVESNESSSYSGQGFVRGLTQPGAAVRFTLPIEEAGEYYLTLRYRDDPGNLFQQLSPVDAALGLYVNGQPKGPTQLSQNRQLLIETRDRAIASLNLVFEQIQIGDDGIVLPPADSLNLLLIDLRSYLTNLLADALPYRRAEWQSKAERVQLAMGTNTITYRYDSDSTGNVALDYLWFSKAVGNGPIGTPILTSDLAIEVQRFVQIPDASNGRPRLNSFAYTGDRVFVSEEIDGHIYEIIDDPQGGKTPQVFLDVKTAIPLNTGRNLNNESTWHSGLRGITFHPEFATNGKFYTSLMEDRPHDPENYIYLSDSRDPINADSVLVEWTYDHGRGAVDIGSYREIFRVGMPVYDHPIRQIAFNPAARPGDPDYGLLYVAHGDGSVQSAIVGGGMGVDGLGKILRINPLQTGADSYTVPSINPFVGDPAMLDEVYSLGHRNPHTLAFAQDDRGSSHLIVGEVGRDNVEEINLIVPGGNYGWPDREGTFVHLQAEGAGIIHGVAPLPDDDARYGYRYPAIQWGHDGQPGQGFVGQGVAAGYVIANQSALDGHFIFADFAESGRLFHSQFAEMLSATTRLDPANPDNASPSRLTQAPMGQARILFDQDGDASTPPLPRDSMKDVIDDEPTYDGSDRADLRFGQGPDGELYILNKRNGYVYLVTNSLSS